MQVLYDAGIFNIAVTYHIITFSIQIDSYASFSRLLSIFNYKYYNNHQCYRVDITME